MTCEEFEELAGAYALDAISDEERTAIEEHLAHCPHCKKLLQELQSIVEVLPLAAPVHAPSANLKGRLLAAIETQVEPRPVILSPHQNQQSPQRKPRWLNWPTSLIAAAAICLLALSSGLTAWNIELQQQVALLKTTTMVVHTYKIQGTTTAPEAKGQIVSIPAQHSTILTMRDLPGITEGKVYQGWLLHCNKPVSIGLFNVVNGVASLNYPGDISNYDVAAVSLEPGPSASIAAPKGEIIATGTLNAGTQTSCNG